MMDFLLDLSWLQYGPEKSRTLQSSPDLWGSQSFKKPFRYLSTCYEDLWSCSVRLCTKRDRSTNGVDHVGLNGEEMQTTAYKV